MKFVSGLIVSIVMICTLPSTLSAEALRDNDRLGAAAAFLNTRIGSIHQDYEDASMEVKSVQLLFNHVVQLKFNNDLKANYTPDQLMELKTMVSISFNRGKTFQSLEAADQIKLTLEDPSDYLSPRTFSILLADKLPESGAIVKLKAKDFIEDVDGNFLSEDYYTPLLVRGMSIKLQSEQYITAGESIQFVADRAGTVLLTQYFPTDGTLEELIENSVKVVEVDESMVGQLMVIETDGVRSGNYRLKAWEGEDIELGISITPHIREDQVTFERNKFGKATITISDVQAGDKLYIFNDIYKPSQGWMEELYTIEVPEGQSMVIVELELDTSGQLVFLLEREGLLLSNPSIHRYEVQ